MGATSEHLFRVSVLATLFMAAVVPALLFAGKEVEAQELPDASCQAASANTAGSVTDRVSPAYNLSFSQTFTALTTGRLTSVRVPLRDLNDMGTLVMEIRPADVVTGVPGSTVLASTSIPAYQVPDAASGGGQVSGLFVPGVKVVAGQQYALVLRASGGAPSLAAEFHWAGNSSNPCPGRSYASTNGGAFLAQGAGDDLFFSAFVTPSNNAPLARNDSYRVNEDKVLRVGPARGVLKNDSDPDGDRLVASMVTTTKHGKLTLRADGSLVYNSNKNFNGKDTFYYKAFDGKRLSNKAKVTIRVRAVAG